MVLDVGVGTATALVRNKEALLQGGLKFVGVDYDAAYIEKVWLLPWPSPCCFSRLALPWLRLRPVSQRSGAAPCHRSGAASRHRSGTAPCTALALSPAPRLLAAQPSALPAARL